MTKNFSIKHGLFSIAGMQVSLTLLFLLYLVSLNTYQAYNTSTNRYYQVGEQFLANVDRILKDLSEATLFPAQLYTENNDSYICRTLREDNMYKNFIFYSNFQTHAKSEFSSQAIDFIALYDLRGNGVSAYPDAQYGIYFLEDTPEWYQNLSQHNTGASLLITAEEFYGSGMFEKDGNSVCIARGIVDLNTIKVVGYCIAGVSTEYLSHIFSQLRLTPYQKFALYQGDKLLYGTVREQSNLELEQISEDREQKRKIQRGDDGKLYVYNVIPYSDGYALVIQTPMSDILGTSNNIQLFYSFLIGVILCTIVCLIIRIVKKILFALNRLIEACNHFEPSHRITVSLDDLPQELRTLFVSFNQMAERINFLVQEVFVKQQQQQETELQLLRTQINPHYLYNTLEIMHMKAYTCGDYDVSSMAELLGKNLQYGLRNTTKEVSLREEIEEMNIYLQILSYQYKDRIRMNVVIEEGLMDCRILKLIFQPIIENAVIHGITRQDQVLSLDILGYKEEESLCLTVTDDGCGMTKRQLENLKQNIEDADSSSIGLRNVCRRIQLNYGNEYKVEIDSRYGMGTQVTIRIPYRSMAQQEVSVCSEFC